MLGGWCRSAGEAGERGEDRGGEGEEALRGLSVLEGMKEGCHVWMEGRYFVGLRHD